MTTAGLQPTASRQGERRRGAGVRAWAGCSPCDREAPPARRAQARGAAEPGAREAGRAARATGAGDPRAGKAAGRT